jgi:hypothetical protein
MDYFEQAFTVTPDKFKDDVSKEIKRKTKQCCDLFYEFHKSKFQNSYNNDGWLWRKLATDIYKSALEEIISILDRAIAIPEEDGVITRTLCNYSINLIKQGPFDKEFTKSKLTDYYNKIKEIDPGFQVPEISDNNCFIATATMGDNNHPYVINLRLLRDKFLLPNALGRILVAAYYFCSPPFASIIAKSPTLRNISLTFLIKPLNKYAVKLLWPSK